MNQVELIPINKINANIYQPRVNFDDKELVELAESIYSNGLIQPIVVRKKDDGYEIIAGERRFRACKMLDFEKVDCIVVEKGDMESAEMALVENIQRQNLSAIEEAMAYKRIIEETNISQNELAKKMGKSQSAIANKIRLLALPKDIQELVSNKTLTERHARALLRVEENKLDEVVHTIVNKNMNVAQSEKYIQTLEEHKEEPSKQTHVTKGYSKNIKIGINTINQAIEMCKKIGIDVTSDIQETNDEVKMVVRFMKGE